MDTSQTLVLIYLVSAIVSLIILYNIIHYAVKTAMNDHRRLLIYDLYKKGVSKDELEKVLHSDNTEFEAMMEETNK